MSTVEKLHKQFIEKKKTLVLAESITGGQIAAALTIQPGASQYFLGSLVTYSDELKISFLDVKKSSLHMHGAVSEEVALEMLQGIFERTSADYGLSVTGIAGPTGDCPTKPIGIVWCALSARGKMRAVHKWNCSGTRRDIIQETVERSVSALLSYMEEHDISIDR